MKAEEMPVRGCARCEARNGWWQVACRACGSALLPKDGVRDGEGLVFTYGTLRPSLGLPLAESVFGRERASRRALTVGRLFALGFPVFVPEAGSGRVVGELVSVTGAELARMDAVEFTAGYTRERVRVWIEETGREAEAWVYAWRHDTSRWRPVPSGDFADHLQAAAAAGDPRRI